MTSESGSVMKEFHRLLRNAEKLYDGQVEIVLNEEDTDENYMTIDFFITPKGGPYRKARFQFKIIVDLSRYPCAAPTITCINDIYHPNIDIKGSSEEDACICVNLLDGDWEPEIGLDGAIMAVLFLFYNPQLDDALSSVCNGIEDYDEYEQNVRRSLRGEEIGGYVFDVLLDDVADSEDNEASEGNGAKDITEGIVVKNEKETGAAAESGDILENVEKEEASSVERLENVEKVDTASEKISENVEKLDGASVAILEHGEKVDTASEKSLINFDRTPQDAPNCSVFKFWYSKLKDVFSPISAFFKRRSRHRH